MWYTSVISIFVSIFYWIGPALLLCTNSSNDVNNRKYNAYLNIATAVSSSPPVYWSIITISVFCEYCYRISRTVHTRENSFNNMMFYTNAVQNDPLNGFRLKFVQNYSRVRSNDNFHSKMTRFQWYSKKKFAINLK